MVEAVNGSTQYVSGRAIDALRPLKVIIIGAGISGILATIRLRETGSPLQIVVYEKNAEVGGTWYENSYPGLACDIPAHTYQLSFESNPKWSKFYAPGPEILEYWKRIVDKYGIRSYMNFSHAVEEARWSEAESKWRLTIRDKGSETTKFDSCDVLITALGGLNSWKWPEIPGLDSFKGDLMHSADWNHEWRAKGKKVAVVGAGSSAIQIVPAIQPLVETLDHYVRGRTWIATPMAAQMLEAKGIKTENYAFTAEEIDAWLRDPSSYLAYRKELENVVQTGHQVTQRGSELSEQARAYFEMLMTKRLSSKPEILTHMLPTFPPLCKRITPGPGYLEALTEGNVEVIPTGIERVSENGILDSTGRFREVDTIICATGFDTSFTNRFPIVGEMGTNLGDRWRNEYPSTYLSMTTHGFPNMFMLLGPNAGLGTGNLLITIEAMVEYIVQCVQKLQSDNIKTIQPTEQSVSTFGRYCEEYFDKTVYSAECSSWYKSRGRVTALWPGSSLHAVQALKRPRWEDFAYTYLESNATGWLGNGATEADDDERADKSGYLTSTAFIQDDLGGVVQP